MTTLCLIQTVMSGYHLKNIKLINILFNLQVSWYSNQMKQENNFANTLCVMYLYFILLFYFVFYFVKLN